MNFWKRNFSFLVLSLLISNTTEASFFCRTFLRIFGWGERRIETSSPIAAHRLFEGSQPTLGDLLLAFSKGLVPDLSKPEERAAFDIYLKARFGSETKYVTRQTVDKVASFLKRHPKLQKPAMSPVRVEMVAKAYPVTPKLDEFTVAKRKSASDTFASLFQIEAFLGDWKKRLGFQDPDVLPALEKGAGREARELKKAFEKRNREAFLKFLDEIIPHAQRRLLADPQYPVRERATILFKILFALRTEMSSKGQKTLAISQAIVDLVHAASFQEEAVVRALKEGNGIERITAFRRAITERDNLAYELGYPGHFNGLLDALGVKQVSGLEAVDSLELTLSHIEKDVLSSAVVMEGQGRTRWVRSLSVVEAPLRSRLGLCCSSDTWLTRGLDPNYQFYTWTDDEGRSSGQVSLTMGDAKQGSKKVKVAFINKIQNIEPHDLPVFLEAVRLSLEKEGYVLGLPEDLGEDIENHGGISNSSPIIEAVKRIPRSDQLIVGFKRHSHNQKYDYDSHSYDRSNLGLSMRPVLPLTTTEGLQFHVEEKPSMRKLPSDFKVEDYVKGTYGLKNSSDPETRLRYIPSMEVLKAAGLADPDFLPTLDRWVGDLSQPFKLRRQALIYNWVQSGKVLAEQLTFFSEEERTTLLQNILATPRFRKYLMENRSQLPHLAVLIRSSKKVRNQLLEEWDKKNSDFYAKILDGSERSDEEVLELLTAARESFRSYQVTAAMKILRLISSAQNREELAEDLKVKWVGKLNHPVRIGAFLSEALSDETAGVREFVESILESRDPRIKAFPIVEIYRDIRSRGGEFEQASLAWMRDPNIAPERKVEFLLAQRSPWAQSFLSLDKAIPQGQRNAIEDIIKRRSTLRAYQKLAQEKGIASSQLEKAKMESFLWAQIPIAPEGSIFKMGSPSTDADRASDEAHVEVKLTKPYQMAATEVTQLQVFLLDEEAFKNQHSSTFCDQQSADDDHQELNGVELNINHPAESLNWDEAEALTRKLAEVTGTSPRLPTEAQWEYAARARSDSAYSFGNDVSELEDHGYYYLNSEYRTHAVAEKNPNAFGLFDMHGNVSEWTADEYMHDLPGGIDPSLQAASGSYRVSFRGGSWYEGARNARSAYREYDKYWRSHSNLGFRPVRTD